MKIFAKLTLLSILCLSQIQAKTLPNVTNVVSCDQLSPNMIQGFAEGMYPDVAIEFNEGSVIPLQFLFNYKIFSLQCNPNLSAKIDTTCYLRCVNKKVYISLDMASWQKPSEFFRGAVVPTIHRSQDNAYVLVQTDLIED
jgi:hypothetical protein